MLVHFESIVEPVYGLFALLNRLLRLHKLVKRDIILQ